VFSEWASLAPNDKLRVTVWQHPEASTPSDGQRIDPSGVLVLPLLGPLELAGLTSQGARALIEEHAAQFIRAPKVTISVLEFGARDFYVLGQIQNVGPQRIDRPLNALQALSYGGPFLPGAARGSVYLLREGDGRLNVHPFDASQPGANSLMAVRPNDVIFVPMSGHGRFAEDVLPYLQGIGLASTFPVALHAVTE
jgi:polysaccharide export outer membrane protein